MTKSFKYLQDLKIISRSFQQILSTLENYCNSEKTQFELSMKSMKKNNFFKIEFLSVCKKK